MTYSYRKKKSGLLLPLLLGIPAAALIIAAERTFILLKENFVLGTFCWILLSVISMWVTLSIAAIVDRKPGDWKLWVLVIVTTIIAMAWLSGYDATVIISLLFHK